MVTSEEVREVLKNPGVLRRWRIEKLLDDHRWVHAWSANNWRYKPRGLTVRECELFHELLVEELERRGVEHYTPIHVTPKEARALEGGWFVEFEDVLPFLRKGFSIDLGDWVFLGGRIVNQGVTWEDIDIIVRSRHLDPSIRKVLSDILKRDGLTSFERFILNSLLHRGVFEPRIRDGVLKLFQGKKFPNPIQITFDPEGGIVGESVVTHRAKLVFEPVEQTFLLTEEEVGHRERLKALARLKEIQILKPFLPLKTVKDAFTSLEVFKPERIVEVWRELFIDAQMRTVAVEKKFDGARLVIHKKNDEVKIFTLSGEDRSKFLPTLVSESRELKLKTGEEIGEVIVDGECVKYEREDGLDFSKPLGREFLAPLIHSTKPFDDRDFVLHVFDILWWEGAPINHLEYRMRREFLERIRDTRHIKKLEFDREMMLARYPEELVEAVKKVSALPGSEGAMLKIWSGFLADYPLDGRTKGWAKFKQAFEVDARVVRKIPKRAEKDIPQLGVKKGEVIEGQWVYECEVGSRETGYSIVGKTFATDVDADVGDILRVQVNLVHQISPREFHWVLPKVLEVREDKTEPDPFSVLIEIARASGGKIIA